MARQSLATLLSVTLYFAVVTAVMTLALFVLLLRPAPENRLSVWLLAGLLPVLVAVTAALWGQTAAARDLTGFGSAVQNRELSWQGPDGTTGSAVIALSGLDAACVVHAAQRGGKYHMDSVIMTVPRGVQLIGAWPTPRQVNALMVSGQLHCRRIGVDGGGDGGPRGAGPTENKSVGDSGALTPPVVSGSAGGAQ